MKRAPHILLILLFLAMVGGVPLAQAIIDVTLEEEDRPLFLSLFEAPPTEEHLRQFESTLEQSSFFEQAIRPLFQLGRYYMWRDLGEKALQGEPGWYFYHPGVKYLTEPDPRQRLKPGTPDPAQVVKDFARQLKTRGIELLVVPVPGKASIYPDRLVSGVQPTPALVDHTRRFTAALRRAGVEVLDLHGIFIKARRSEPGGPALYMEADTHWTGQGACLAAAAVAQKIKSRPWFAALSRKQRYTRQEVTLLRRGDVPRMTQIPRQEQLFAAQRITCYRVFHAEGDTPYADKEAPAEAPILVLGDSFSRVFETDEPGSAGWIANLAFELQQPVDAIVNDGGASTLVRQELARDLDRLKHKRLVVWAFVERDIRFGLQGWQPLELWP